MSERDDHEAIAAEYALGTLDRSERLSALELMRADPSFAALVRGWEEQLSPLAELQAEIEPPARVFTSIMQRLDRPWATPRTLIFPRRRLALPLMAALAACLAIFIAWQAQRWISAPLVADLENASGVTGFELSLDENHGAIAARPLRAKTESGKSYELWLVAKGEPPRAYGLLDPDRPITLPLRSDLLLAKAATWAVSLEPEGGSKSQGPSGPVVFQGRFQRS